MDERLTDQQLPVTSIVYTNDGKMWSKCLDADNTTRWRCNDTLTSASCIDALYDAYGVHHVEVGVAPSDQVPGKMYRLNEPPVEEYTREDVKGMLETALEELLAEPEPATIPIFRFIPWPDAELVVDRVDGRTRVCIHGEDMDVERAASFFRFAKGVIYEFDCHMIAHYPGSSDE